MRSTHLVILAFLFGLVLMMILLWHRPIDPQGERADPAPPLRPLPVRLDPQDEQAKEMRPSLPNPASAPSHALAPIEHSPSGRNRGGFDSDAVNEPAPPSLAVVRSTLADAIAAHLPDLALSDDELDDLAGATLRMRTARAQLRSLPKTREQASRRDEIRRSLEEAIVDFTRVVEMTPDEFTRHVQPDVGIDELAPGEVPDDVSIRTLPRVDEAR